VFRRDAVPDSFDDLTMIGKKKHDSDTTPGTPVTWGDGINSIYPDDIPPENVYETDLIFA